MIDTKDVRRELGEAFDRTSVFAVAYERIPALCDRVDELLAALAAAEARADDADKRAAYYQDFQGRLAEWRGVEAAELCQKCGGLGQAGYSDTSTWHRGIGGQAMTSDVCDKCWGSGIAKRPGADLRAIGARIKAAEARAEGAETELVGAYEGADELRAANQQLEFENGVLETIAARAEARAERLAAVCIVANDLDPEDMEDDLSYASIFAKDADDLQRALDALQPGDLGGEE